MRSQKLVLRSAGSSPLYLVLPNGGLVRFEVLRLRQSQVILVPLHLRPQTLLRQPSLALDARDVCCGIVVNALDLRESRVGLLDREELIKQVAYKVACWPDCCALQGHLCKDVGIRIHICCAEVISSCCHFQRAVLYHLNRSLGASKES
ncbi:hypothetical protein Naga_100681g3 [Nannochloropsis gaditana]|uniref:Uncharacterized protein n=1 Tax=Nannochloropsis gaditana TaxID=72520 RepID=W7SZC2_9STRA|nr:hypothetical protein Naga_100681g3 [Nannochloropsis gaditana]